MTKAPAAITDASFVSRQAVRIALMVAALNHHYVKLSNILNAYIQASVTEKVRTTSNHEFA